MTALIFHQMTRPELNKVNRDAIVVLPLGSTEQHGLHLPVDTDTRLITALCQEMEHRMPDKILLTPTFWLGHSPHHLDFGGTLSLNYDVYSRVLVEIITIFVKSGYRKLWMVNGHGGNGMPMAIVQQEIKLHFPEVMLCAGNYWDLAKQELKDMREGGPYAMGHACELETSLYLYLNEAGVRKNQICDAGIPNQSGYFGYGMFNGGAMSYLSNFSEFTDTGAFGKPTLATAEKGKKMFLAIADNMEKFARYLYDCETLATKKGE